jgi:hypothetical protein
MHGVVSLLDSHYSQVVEDLWAELERRFGVDGVYERVLEMAEARSCDRLEG